MSGLLTLTPVDSRQLDAWLAALARQGSRQHLFERAVAEAKPWATEADRKLLQRAEHQRAPRDALLSLGIRTAPTVWLPELLARADKMTADCATAYLLELAMAGRGYVVSVDPDVLLAYFSEAYRFDLTGTNAADRPVPVYDGPAVILEALGRDAARPDTPVSIVLSPARVREIGATLASLDVSRYPRGDLRVVYEYIEDYVDPEYWLSRASVDEAVAAEIAGLVSHYQTAASRGWGLRVQTGS